VQGLEVQCVWRFAVQGHLARGLLLRRPPRGAIRALVQTGRLLGPFKLCLHAEAARLPSCRGSREGSSSKRVRHVHPAGSRVLREEPACSWRALKAHAEPHYSEP